MKLLTNKNYDSILSYFPGIDFPNLWTMENPAVYHCVKSFNENKVIIPQFTYLSEAKYLLFKVQGGVSYSIWASNNYYSNLKAYFYNYLNYKKEDVERNINYIDSFIIPPFFDGFNDIYVYDFFFQYPTYILMKIIPNGEYSLKKSFSLNFNNIFLEFDYTTHWIRDWANKVDGTTWEINGKLNSSNSLHYLNNGVGRSIHNI